ncbi:uncharacterized protein [Miscanthus floridulus]|uniref:uncharacterized protein n=1 Tax=Miscanthus floridulus TaxID=154761 RepID=UPI00345ABE46
MHLTKVLMGRDSGLNILYASTLDKIGTPWISQCPSKAPFYGIVLGKEAVPLGRIRLNVTFDRLDNFCKEPLTFEVVNFPSVYRALLGRSCFARFLVVPNYTYLKLKMPSAKGVITVEGSFKQAYYYEQECATQAAMLVAPCALDSPSHDARRALVEEASKTAAVLDRPSIEKAVKTSSCSGGSASPSI